MAEKHNEEISKKIIVCLDGTWNSYFSFRQEETSWTNVQKIRTLITSNDGKIPQIVLYSRGVGTGHWFDMIVGGIWGEGVDEAILDAYMMICDNYNEGDDIYLFGFSRGAVAARAVASMISECGILNKKSQAMIKTAWTYFCSEPHERTRDNKKYEEMKNSTVGKKIPKIKFLGVWDTVFGGTIFRLETESKMLSHSVKFDLSRLRFTHDKFLSSNIENAYHALAIDERREVFQPILWDTSADAHPDQVIEQVWFPGSHSDVGGGLEKSDLSDISLRWMIGKAKKAGLRFDEKLIKETVTPNIKGAISNSARVWDAAGVSDRSIDLHDSTIANQYVHVSALCRYKSRYFKEPRSEYAPQFLLDVHSENGRNSAAQISKKHVTDLDNLEQYKKQLGDGSLKVEFID